MTRLLRTIDLHEKGTEKKANGKLAKSLRSVDPDQASFSVVVECI